MIYIDILTFVTILSLPAGYTFFPAVRVAARVMSEPIVSRFAKFGASLSVVVAITSDTNAIRHACGVTQVRQSFPLVTR